jgi:hypothetical protein
MAAEKLDGSYQIKWQLLQHWIAASSHSGSAIVLPTMLAVSCSIIVQLKCKYWYIKIFKSLTFKLWPCKNENIKRYLFLGVVYIIFIKILS